MRITTKIASAGDTFLGRFPVLPCSIDELKDERGGIDMGKVLAALREYDSTITWSSSDDLGVVALAVEFIRQMESATKKLDQDEEADVRTQCEKAVDRSLERKMDRGRFGYCRIEIDRHGGHLRVRIGILRRRHGFTPSRSRTMRSANIMHGAALVYGDLATTVRRLTLTVRATRAASASRRSSGRSGSGTSGFDLNHEIHERRKSCGC